MFHSAEAMLNMLQWPVQVAVLPFVLAPTTANWDLLTCMYSIAFLIISGVPLRI